ncbi:MAG TPA: clan AA aspartic protease [Tepidisphaeraceae bacterium]|jgi:clan AA aspartic protease|nr:clan AA aspartic protease [Tepidisphaeraceae bacterium]
MGATQVTVAVSNPGDPNKRWEGLFLVDTGAIDCMAPAKHLREIGIMPRGKRTYELADGSEIILEIGVATVEFMGEVVGATIIFGDDDVEPILGVTALESVGIEVDPQNQRLKRLPAVRLKGMRSANEIRSDH